MKVPFFDVQALHAELEQEIMDALRFVLQSGEYILGRSLTTFERKLAQYLDDSGSRTEPNVGFAVGCNSGTDALLLSLLASGVGPGSEVITVSHTALPTIAAICAVGAVPVFADIDPDTWVMDMNQAVSRITPRTKAIIPVHLYGNMADVQRLQELLRSSGRGDIRIIEDTAQAHGSRFKGKQAGTLGDYGAFSFYPTKNIGAIGDAGAVYCSEPEQAELLKVLRNYGQKDRYHAEVLLGRNSRLDDMQAAILSVKLNYLERWNRRKADQMLRYRDQLSGLPLQFQRVTGGCTPGWHLCVIALENEAVRDSLARQLAARGIGTHIHYPIPAHLQVAFSRYADQSLPVTEQLSKRILSLPMNPSLTGEQQQAVIEAVRSLLTTN